MTISHDKCEQRLQGQGKAIEDKRLLLRAELEKDELAFGREGLHLPLTTITPGCIILRYGLLP